MPAPGYAPAPAAIAGWVVLAIGTVRLALPQRDVRQIELASDLSESSVGEGREIGWLVRPNGSSWPAYSFDESLCMERPASAGRRLCVFFGVEEQTRGLLCDRVWSLAADADLRVAALPGCMAGVRSPATGLARFGDGAALVSDHAALTGYLDFLTEPENGAHG